MEQIVDLAPMVQILDTLVPQAVDQPVDVLTIFGISVPEKVIEVPKISCPLRPRRAPHAATLMAELVEVPTVVSSCSSPSRTLTFQFLALVVLLTSEVFKVFTQDRVPHCLLPSRSLTFQFRVAAFKILLPVQGSAASSAVLPEYPVSRVFFSHFSRGKKVRRSPSR